MSNKKFNESIFGCIDKGSNEGNEPNNTNDNVNHPRHYTSDPSGIECIEITKHRDFCIGSAIKYLWRAGLKQEEGMTDTQKMIEDLQKAIWYINAEIEMLRKEENQ